MRFKHKSDPETREPGRETQAWARRRDDSDADGTPAERTEERGNNTDRYGGADEDWEEPKQGTVVGHADDHAEAWLLARDADDDADIDFETSSGKMPRRGFFYVMKKTVGEFLDDGCTDLAAALTYYSVQAVFPALLALVSILSLVGASGGGLQTVKDTIKPLVSTSMYNNFTKILDQLSSSQGAGVTLIVGILLALYSASAYVGAFGRALNRILEVQEGRPVWKLKPANFLVTVVTIILIALTLLILVVSGPVAQSVGNAIGLGSQTVQVFNIAKWPVLAVAVVANVAVLYHFTPNVKMPKFRILSIGAFVAILVWVAASVGFAFYVANFSSYNKTYGSVAGVIIALLWIWITNIALLFGAELDAEIERARELHAGREAERNLTLPVRDDRGIRKSLQKREKDWEAGRKLRLARGGSGDPEDRPFGRRGR